jgi:hypothetical protein
MNATTTDTRSGERRARLRRWLRRHDRSIARQAESDIEDTEALSEAARRGSVSQTQLRSLLNTASVCSLTQLREYVGKRRDRREGTDQKESDFWDALLTAISDLEEPFAQPAIEACGAADTTPETVESDTLDEREVETIVVRRYLSHFVPHCQYLQQLSNR